MEFEADEKDHESDEALWALYERWCKHFNAERDRDEMARSPVQPLQGDCYACTWRSDLPYRLAINMFADGNSSALKFLS
jgi:hypothetical protein